MPYKYQESPTLSRQNALAVKSLATTGELPKNHYWNALRSRHDANPTRFDRGNVVLSALLDRDQLQRMGKLGADAPLFPNSKFFSYASAKHALNAARFDRWHPFLGRLFNLRLPTLSTTTAEETLTLTPTKPAGSSLGIGTDTATRPPSSLLPGIPGGGGGTNVPVPTPRVDVPEPASAILLGTAVVLALLGSVARRWFRSDRSAAPVVSA